MMTHRPYVKTTVLSVFIHLLFFFLAFFMGEAKPAFPPPSPIEIEIEPSRLLDTGSGTLNLASGSPFPGPKTVKRKIRFTAGRRPRKADSPKVEEARVAAPAPVPPGTYPPAAPGEAVDTSVAVPVSDGGQSEGAGSGGGGAGGSGTGNSPGDGIGTTGYTGAGYRSGALPPYPGAARRAGREGLVLLRVLVATNGSVASVTVRETSGYDDFDSVAVRAVRKWRFSPARRAGQPVASFHDVRVRFRLEGVK